MYELYPYVVSTKYNDLPLIIERNRNQILQFYNGMVVWNFLMLFPIILLWSIDQIESIWSPDNTTSYMKFKFFLFLLYSDMSIFKNDEDN